MPDLQHLIDRAGRYPLLNLRLLARHPGETIDLRRLERRLSRQARSQLRQPISADVVTIIPTHGRGLLLQQAVASALRQDVPNHHILVVDDGKGLPDLPNDPRLTAVSLSRNIGIAGVVRNVGIRLTSSRLLAFLDDDNVWDDDHLRLSLRAHRQGPVLSYAGLTRRHPDGRVLDQLSQPFSRQLLKSRAYIDTSTIVVARTPKTWWSRVPRRFGDSPGEDWELVWRMSRHLHIVRVPHVTVDVLVNPQSSYQNWSARGASSA